MAFVTYFNILGAYADLSLKQIIIETNFKVKQSSLTFDNILVYEMLEDNNHELAKLYSLKLDEEDESKIIIEFEEYPEDNKTYYIVVKNLIDRLNRPLYHNFDKYIKFSYNIKTLPAFVTPINQTIFKNNNIEFNIATSCEDNEIYYRIEISHNVAFFKSEYITFKDKKEIENSNNGLISLIGADVSDKDIKALICFKEDGQYYARIRAEKSKAIHGKWSDIITFSVTTAQSPLQDNSGFLDDFLYSESLFKEEFKPLEILSYTKKAKTTKDLFLEFNKDISFKEDIESQYDEDGLLFIGSAFLIRRDL